MRLSLDEVGEVLEGLLYGVWVLRVEHVAYMYMYMYVYIYVYVHVYACLLSTSRAFSRKT